MKEEKENEKEKEEEDEKFSRVKLSLSESRFPTVRLEDTTRSGAVGSGDGGSGASSRSLNNFERGPWVRRCSDIPDTLPQMDYVSGPRARIKAGSAPVTLEPDSVEKLFRNKKLLISPSYLLGAASLVITLEINSSSSKR
ncbi:hypothetical protein HZH68_004302 [Vespula germanica]|uniref:Uncharacterized protein n=1 Tax=Vespula germanica TaxID=30212 RepID=A0A834KTL9_VESGE|nr:hypothetical protein HZH68_004302 [Vespula germanica]